MVLPLPGRYRVAIEREDLVPRRRGEVKDRALQPAAARPSIIAVLEGAGAQELIRELGDQRTS
jgi:hypothetical protein